MAKLLKLRRGSTSDHGSFIGAEGEVTVDTTKDTLVVHDGSTQGGFPVLRASGGAQNISTTGTISSNNITVTDTNPKIALVDSNNNSDFEVQNDNGNFNIEDTTNTANRLRIDATGVVNIPGNTDFGAGIDVTGAITNTGNITTTGQINIESASPRLHLSDTNSEDDFSVYNQNGNFLVYNEDDNRADITIASDGQIDFAGNVDCNSGLDVTGGDITGVLGSAVTGTTQSAGDNSTKIATTAYTDTAISNLVSSAPSTLDTLNELAAALGDDANFSTTVTSSIAAKLPLAGGTLTGALTGTKATFLDNGATSPILQVATDDNSPWGLAVRNDSYWNNESNGFKVYQDNNGDIDFRATGNSEFINWRFNMQNGGTTHTAIHLDTSGAVNINHQGSTKGYSTSSGWSVNGDMVATGNVTAYSDESLKKDISTINDALGICGKLRGVSYKWIENDKADIGVVAQEVEKVIPEVVVTQTVDGKDIKSVDYGRIVGVLINAINEQQVIIEEQNKAFTLSCQAFQEQLDKLKGDS